MRRGLIGLAVVVPALCAAGCASHPPRQARDVTPPKYLPTAMLVVYAAPDGSLTRAQMEAGLRRDFDKLDTRHAGCLNDDQVRAVNEQRWKEDASTASPLIDFRHNGCVDFDEFAATPRSLFDQLDRDGTGKLTAQQLRPGPAKPAEPGQNQPTGEGHHRGGGAQAG